MSKKKHIKRIKTATKIELKTYFTESLLFETCNPTTQPLFQEVLKLQLACLFLE